MQEEKELLESLRYGTDDVDGPQLKLSLFYSFFVYDSIIAPTHRDVSHYVDFIG